MVVGRNDAGWVVVDICHLYEHLKHGDRVRVRRMKLWKGLSEKNGLE